MRGCTQQRIREIARVSDGAYLNVGLRQVFPSWKRIDADTLCIGLELFPVLLEVAQQVFVSGHLVYHFERLQKATVPIKTFLRTVRASGNEWREVAVMTIVFLALPSFAWAMDSCQEASSLLEVRSLGALVAELFTPFFWVTHIISLVWLEVM